LLTSSTRTCTPSNQCTIADHIPVRSPETAAIATGMTFVPSVQGRSRWPAELSTWEDIEAGADVLLAMVHALATD
jgi:hypothetical protein